MAELDPQSIDRSGLSATYDSADGSGDTFDNSGKPKLIHVKNGDTSDHTVTVTSYYDDPPAGTGKEDVSVTIGNGDDEFIGPFPKRGYNNTSGQVEISYDAVTSVTIAVLTLEVE